LTGGGASWTTAVATAGGGASWTTVVATTGGGGSWAAVVATTGGGASWITLVATTGGGASWTTAVATAGGGASWTTFVATTGGGASGVAWTAVVGDVVVSLCETVSAAFNTTVVAAANNSSTILIIILGMRSFRAIEQSLSFRRSSKKEAGCGSNYFVTWTGQLVQMQFRDQLAERLASRLPGVFLARATPIAILPWSHMVQQGAEALVIATDPFQLRALADEVIE
jgi:hypothetical protein